MKCFAGTNVPPDPEPVELAECPVEPVVPGESVPKDQAQSTPR